MKIFKNIDLIDYNFLKISYTCNCLFEIENTLEIYILLYIFKELKIDYLVIGNGSKIIFKDSIYTIYFYIKKASKRCFFAMILICEDCRKISLVKSNKKCEKRRILQTYVYNIRENAIKSARFAALFF